MSSDEDWNLDDFLDLLRDDMALPVADITTSFFVDRDKDDGLLHLKNTRSSRLSKRKKEEKDKEKKFIILCNNCEKKFPVSEDDLILKAKKCDFCGSSDLILKMNSKFVDLENKSNTNFPVYVDKSPEGLEEIHYNPKAMRQNKIYEFEFAQEKFALYKNSKNEIELFKNEVD